MPFLYAVDYHCVLGAVDLDYWFLGLIFYLMICTEWEQLPAPWLHGVPAVAQWLRGEACSCVAARMRAVARLVAEWLRGSVQLRGCEDLDAVARTIVGMSSRRWLWQFRRAMWSCQWRLLASGASHSVPSNMRR